MSKTTAFTLQSLQNATLAAFRSARYTTGGINGLIDEAWQNCRDETHAAPDDDVRAEVANKFFAVFTELASLGMDDLMVLAEPLMDAARDRARKRAVLDRRPALAAWNLERDARAVEVQRRIDATAAREAERIRHAAPQALLTALRASGSDLTLDKHGRLLGRPEAIAGVPGGLDAVREHRDALVAILKAEAEARAAAAEASKPVVLA